MTASGIELLEHLSRWADDLATSSSGRCAVRSGAGDPSWKPRSAWVDVRGQHRWGQLCVWESGQIELEITDIESVEMAHSQSEVVGSVERLDQLLAELLREVEANLPG